MATGSPVSFWYGTRAQFDSITTKLDTTLYFITDEQALYKGTVKFSGSGVDTLLTISSTTPSASSVTTGDKYFDTSDNLIHVLKNENGTVTTTATYEPANGALYYNADAQRFQTLIKDGSSYIPTEIYDAGISVEDSTGLVLNGTTVAGLDATTNSKGVVQVGSNLNVSNGVISVPVATNAVFGVVKSGSNITNNNGVLSVGKATTSALGVVKVGSNINVDNNGQISVPVANGSTKGVVSAGENVYNSNGVLSVNTASTSTKGVVKVGTNIDVDNGVLSVKDASTSNKGVVQLTNDLADIHSTTLAATPNLVETVTDDLDGRKQDNMSATAPVDIENSNVSLNIGDGLTVGVTGTTNANKLITDNATVEEILTDSRKIIVEGATESTTINNITDRVVEPHDLKGALSVGQAVDVSCAPYPISSSNSLTFENGDYLEKVTWVSTTAQTYSRAGFDSSVSGGAKAFPKYASGLKYLVIADIKNTGNSSKYFTGGLGTIKSATIQPGETSRVAFATTDSTRLYFVAHSTEASVLSLEITNWREYEVTNLTDEAIDYLASLPNPDAFFRSTSAYSIRDKYLIKQDMVCPFIPTINMPDNSDLTVAAGLSYKIKYTNDNTHTITADTIPTDAYGWDTHIQMFIKGTSAINFQKPLVLMDALTPNAGHNLSVKWRNGDALVYVDDTNAGYIVTVASGTETGSLYDGISNDYTDYVIFAAGLDGTTIDAGDATFAGGTGISAVNVLGNGKDKTIITGNISATSGNTINFQSLTIDGGTFGGAGNMSLDDTAVEGSVYVESPATMRFSTVNVLNGTVSGSGKLVFADGATVSSVVPSGSTIGTGLITGFTVSSSQFVSFTNATFENISITDFTPGGAGAGLVYVEAGKTVVFRNCYIRHTDTHTGRFIRIGAGGTIVVDGCVSEGSANAARYMYITGNGATMYISDSDLITLCVGCGNATFSGNSTVHNLAIGVSGATNHTGVITITDGSTVTFDSTTFTKCEIYTHVVGHATLIVKGLETGLSGCTFRYISSNARIAGNPNITVDSMSVWSAENAIFAAPLDASAANTIKLTGTTFTTTAKTLNASRIQLPASTTVSFQGNTNPANTKILDASIIVVGDNPASPSGSATVVNASGTTSTVSGIGTYIDKEGDNDFVANNATNIVPVDGSTTGAKYLGTVLSATTGDTGANRFAKIDSGAVAVVNEATNAVNKQIITHDYEPILGGTFSLTSATVDEATKTVAIQSGGTMSVVDIRGGKDSVIDLGGTNVVLSSGGTAYASGCIFTGGSATSGGALSLEYGYAKLVLDSCIVSGNTAQSYGRDIYTLGTLNIINSVIGDCRTAGGFGSVTIAGSNTIGNITKRNDVATVPVTISSGASINLTNSINPGGGIVVEAGGCTVNGVEVAGGTYTSIVSSGGSAVIN